MCRHKSNALILSVLCLGGVSQNCSSFTEQLFNGSLNPLTVWQCGEAGTPGRDLPVLASRAKHLISIWGNFWRWHRKCFNIDFESFSRHVFPKWLIVIHTLMPVTAIQVQTSTSGRFGVQYLVTSTSRQGVLNQRPSDKKTLALPLIHSYPYSGDEHMVTPPAKEHQLLSLTLIQTAATTGLCWCG